MPSAYLISFMIQKTPQSWHLLADAIRQHAAKVKRDLELVSLVTGVTFYEKETRCKACK